MKEDVSEENRQEGTRKRGESQKKNLPSEPALGFDPGNFRLLFQTCLRSW